MQSQPPMLQDMGIILLCVPIQVSAKDEYVVPLSEKFRMAYVSRAERVAAKAERNYQQRVRRKLRNDTVLQALARFKFL